MYKTSLSCHGGIIFVIWYRWIRNSFGNRNEEILYTAKEIHKANVNKKFPHYINNSYIQAQVFDIRTLYISTPLIYQHTHVYELEKPDN